MKQRWFNWLVLTVAVVMSVVLYSRFMESESFRQLQLWAKNNWWTMFGLVGVVKFLGIVWPPVPGGVAVIASVPFIGWWGAFLADFVFSMAGSTVAYYVGKKYGFPIINKLMGEEIEKQVRSIRIKKGRELETVMVYRVLMAPILFEAISWSAGLLGVSYQKMMLGIIIPHVGLGIPMYYFTGRLIADKAWWWAVIPMAIVIPLIFILKKRYFEKE